MSKISVTTIAGLTSGGDANTVKIESGDDFVVDTNVLKVDSSNNRVGIGTASPTQDLTIVNSGSARMELVSGTSGTSIIDMGDSADKDIGGIRYVQSSDTMQFRAGNDVRMSIDGNGYVTKSNQPSWFQYVIGDGTFSSGWKNVPLNPNASSDFPYHILGGVTTANGNHEVTVPVAGQYQINGAVTLNSASVNTDGTLTLSKNNSTMGGGRSVGVYSGALGGNSISMVVTLAANDTVGMDYYFSGSATYRNTQYAGYFSGYLLG